jgi:hypothetical protein
VTKLVIVDDALVNVNAIVIGIKVVIKGFEISCG